MSDERTPYEQHFAEAVWDMEPEEFVELARAYDAYIADANENDLYVSGWRPVTLMEFHDNEWQQGEKLTTDEWENAYSPLDGPSGSLVWEYAELGDTPESRIWSLVDGDSGAIWALPGYRVVNVFGYAVTETPWEHRNIEARYDDTDTEDTDDGSGSA